MNRHEVADCRPTPFVGDRAYGLRAPGHIVMVVHEGSGWVLRQDGTREDLSAESVVIWNPGDWVEYGSDSGGKFKSESYWAADLSEEEWTDIFAQEFGSEAPG